MPISYHTDYVEGLVEVSFSGKIKGQELIEGLEKIFSDEHWCHTMPQLWDGSQICELDVDFSDLMAIRSMVITLLYPDRMYWGRTAIIVRSRITYMFVRMLQAFFEKEKKHSRIFSIEERHLLGST